MLIKIYHLEPADLCFSVNIYLLPDPADLCFSVNIYLLPDPADLSTFCYIESADIWEYGEQIVPNFRVW